MNIMPMWETMLLTLGLVAVIAGLTWYGLEGHKFAGWITVKNFCNLLNSEWCVLRQVSFPRRQAIVDMEISPDGQYYIYEDYIEPSGQGRVTDPSLWEIRVGLTYRF